MFYLSIIMFYIAGILFFSSVKITYTGGNIMNFRVTDPTILWAAVGAIIVGVVGAIFFLYRESRHTKEIQETTTESKTVLLRHDALTDKNRSHSSGASSGRFRVRPPLALVGLQGIEK